MEKKPDLFDGKEIPVLPKPSMSEKSVFISLAVLFIIFSSCLFYLKTTNFTLPRFTIFSGRNLSFDLDRYFDQKLEGEVSKNGEFEIRITERELKDILKTNSPDFPLKNADIKILKDGIKISGKEEGGILTPKIDIMIVPKAELGKIIFEITEIKAAGVIAPSKISHPISENLQRALNLDQYLTENNLDIQEARTIIGSLYIKGEKRD